MLVLSVEALAHCWIVLVTLYYVGTGFETHCIGCTMMLLTKVWTLACKKNCELIGNYTLEKGCTQVGVCLHCDLYSVTFPVGY